MHRFTTVVVLVLLIVFPLEGSHTAHAAHYERTLSGEESLSMADTVRGQVTNAKTNQALPGVNVLAKGTQSGTVTDSEGRYELAVPQEADSLFFSFVGFETAQVALNGRSEINVALRPETYVAEELVVVGYGAQEREDLTGAISSVQPEDIERGPTTSVGELLQGKVPGLEAVSSGGAPGSGFQISIRGASSVTAGTGPLVVVDGFPSNTPVNPGDIESIEVLKGPSATAIYGARGANGVILISTKSGREGDLQVSYTAEVGVQTPSNKLDLLKPQEYKQVLNELIEAGAASPDQRVEDISNGGTNWQDEVLRSAPIQNHDVSFSGGTESTSYYASLGAARQQGIVEDSGFERYNAKITVNYEVTGELNLGARLNGLYRRDDEVHSSFANNLNAGALYAAYNYDPTAPVRNENGEFFEAANIASENPLASINGDDQTNNNQRVYGTFFAEYNVIPSLALKVQLGGDLFNSRQDRYISRLTQVGRSAGGRAVIDQTQNRDFLAEATATYDNSFAEHHELNILGGITAQKFYNENTFMEATGFPTDATGTKNFALADAETYDANSYTATNQLLSYIGRVNYSLMDRYRLTATMRVDGSSRFGSGSRFGVFPSAALAWSLGQESFMEGVGFVDRLKPRISWGRTGNQSIGDYASLVTFSPAEPVIWEDNEVATTSPARFGNSNLKWETTEQINLGLDFGVLSNRVSGSLNYYWKDTYDMLLNLPVPQSTGYNTQLTNIGSVSNRGLELSLRSENVAGRDFGWSTNLNLTTLQNEVQSLGPISDIITGGAGFTNQISIIRPGLPIRTYYGYDVVGIWQEGDDFSETNDDVQPGSIKYRDVNGDNTINPNDRVPLGDSFPDLTWSIGNTFSYKNLGLYVFIQGSRGVSMLNNNLVGTYFPISFRRNRFAEPLLNRWTPENPSDKYPSFVAPLSQGRKGVNSRTIQDASYARLQTVRLSYDVPFETSLYRFLTIYGVAENLYTLTNYDGVDPAINPNNSATFRIDFNAYPSTTTFTLGVRLGL